MILDRNTISFPLSIMLTTEFKCFAHCKFLPNVSDQPGPMLGHVTTQLRLAIFHAILLFTKGIHDLAYLNLPLMYFIALDSKFTVTCLGHMSNWTLSK